MAGSRVAMVKVSRWCGQTTAVQWALKLAREPCIQGNVRLDPPWTKLRQLCEGKTTCSLSASNSLVGDPCRGTRKYLEVHYTCGGTFGLVHGVLFTHAPPFPSI